MVSYIVKLILLLAKRNGLKEDMSWEKYNRILYNTKKLIDNEIVKHYKTKNN